MRIELNRGIPAASCQRSLWGSHFDKVWTALRGGCPGGHTNPDSVYGMVLCNASVYPDSGAYIPFDVYGKRESRWLNASDAILRDFEQHMSYEAGAVWLWLVLGTCDKQYLVPRAELFHLIPPSPDLMAWDRPWQDTAAIMCISLCVAVARDEYAKETIC